MNLTSNERKVKLSGISNKDVRQLIRKAQAHGVFVFMTPSKHIGLSYQGRQTRIALTSSSSKALIHAKQRLRKIGFDVRLVQ